MPPNIFFKSLIFTALITNVVDYDTDSESRRMKGAQELEKKVKELQNLDILPAPHDCGLLREEQFFNLKQSAERNEFPWVITLIQLAQNREIFGILLSKQYILASTDHYRAAFPKNAYDIYIIFMGNCSSTSCDHLHREIYLVKFLSKFLYDPTIALLRLRDPIDRFTDDIRPICLPSPYERYNSYVGQHMIWTTHQNVAIRRVKQFVLIHPYELCYQSLGVDIYDNVLCTNICDNTRSIPYHITGSILMGIALNNSKPNHYFLAGLQNNAGQHCLPGQMQTFERIDNALGWITFTIAEAENISSFIDER